MLTYCGLMVTQIILWKSLVENDIPNSDQNRSHCQINLTTSFNDYFEIF